MIAAVALGLVLGAAAAVPSGARGVGLDTWLADLPDGVRPSVSGEVARDPHAILQTILASAPPRRERGGPLTVTVDPRWYRDASPGPAAPLLLLRRWPGDTVLALWAVRPSAPVPVQGSWHGVDATPSSNRRFEGQIDTEMGSRAAVWAERTVEGAALALGGLLVAGDAGLGTDGKTVLAFEAEALWSRVEIDPAAWARLPMTLAVSEVEPPDLGGPTGGADERTDPWQTLLLPGLSIGFPPGLDVARLDTGVPAPRPVANGLVWFRGRFTDRDGTEVVVGDGVRAGYVAGIRDPSAAWRAGTEKPGVPGAVFIAGESYESVPARTGANFGRVERWSEPGYAGEWLVFRLGYGSAGVEIGIPALAGRRSPALYWIPLTVRAAGQPPAPPPLEPSDRFGIRFETPSSMEAKRTPFLEGTLYTPGLRVDLPKGVRPRATVRSKKGFPVTLVQSSGGSCGRIVLLEDAAAVERTLGQGTWQPLKRPSAHGAQAVWDREDGARLFVSKGGGGYLFEPAAEAARSQWDGVTLKVMLLQPSRGGKAGGRS